MLFKATLTAEVISWRGRPDNAVAVGLDPKNSSSAGGALNHCATGPLALNRSLYRYIHRYIDTIHRYIHRYIDTYIDT